MPSNTFTEKDILLISLLREIPYITSDLVWKFFYPNQKNNKYALEKLTFLKKLKFVNKIRKSDSSWIWYLTEFGHENVSKFLFKLKGIPQVKDGIIFNPNPNLEYKTFNQNDFSRFPEYHTLSLIEFYFLVSKSRCFYNKILLDSCINKKSELDIKYNADLLLSNGLDNSEGRIFVEIENSRIREKRLADKINNLTKMPADYFLFIATEKDIFTNLGRLIRKISAGESKVLGKTISFSHESRAALLNKILIGFWPSPFKNNGEISLLSSVSLYRYDNPIFNKMGWQNMVINGVIQKDENGVIKREMKKIPFSGVKSGKSEFLLGDIFKKYRPQCLKQEKIFLDS